MNNMNFIEKCEKKLEDKFKSVDEIAYFNQVKILNAFSDASLNVILTGRPATATMTMVEIAWVSFMLRFSVPKTE